MSGSSGSSGSSGMSEQLSGKTNPEHIGWTWLATSPRTCPSDGLTLFFLDGDRPSRNAQWRCLSCRRLPRDDAYADNARLHARRRAALQADDGTMNTPPALRLVRSA